MVYTLSSIRILYFFSSSTWEAFLHEILFTSKSIFILLLFCPARNKVAQFIIFIWNHVVHHPKDFLISRMDVLTLLEICCPKTLTSLLNFFHVPSLASVTVLVPRHYVFWTCSVLKNCSLDCSNHHNSDLCFANMSRQGNLRPLLSSNTGWWLVDGRARVKWGIIYYPFLLH